jgi:hypothetical protein
MQERVKRVALTAAAPPPGVSKVKSLDFTGMQAAEPLARGCTPAGRANYGGGATVFHANMYVNGSVFSGNRAQDRFSSTPSSVCRHRLFQ